MTDSELRRRRLLAGLATAGATGLAGCNGIDGALDGGGTDADLEDAAGTFNASADGLVVPVAQGLGADDAVDPTETDTPVQDAVDAIREVGEWPAEGGAVLLPPGVVDEAGPLVGTRDIWFLGWGPFASTIRFTTLDEPGIAQDPDVDRDAGNTYWDGLRLHGRDGAERTAPAIHLQNHPPADRPNSIPAFNMGRVRFDHWGDPVIHLDENFWFETHWEWVEMKREIHGRAILAEGAEIGGSGWTAGKLNFRRVGTGRIVHAVESGGSFTIGSLHLASVDAAGESQSVPIVDFEALSGDVHLQQVHHETGHAALGTELAGHTAPSMLRFHGGGAQVRLGSVNPLRGTFDAVVDLTGSLKRARIRSLNLGGTGVEGAAPIRVTGDPPLGWNQRAGIVYEGPSEHVVDETGSRLGNVYALGDQRVVDPMFAGTVTHETGGPTRLRGVTNWREGQHLRDRELRRVTPSIQLLEPVELPDAPFRVDHGFEYDPDGGENGTWDLLLEWRTDPGVDVEFVVEVVCTSADGLGVDLGGREG